MAVRRRKSSNADKRELRERVWSYSKLNAWAACPLKYRLEYIDKTPTKKGPALLRGSKIHDEAETYLNTKRGAVPASCELFEGEFKTLRRVNAIAEASWAFDKDWKVCGWVEPNTWVRMKVDAHYVKGHTATIVDFKTGKIRPDHDAQLELYGLGALLMYPDVEEVISENWYLDSADLHDSVTSRDELGFLIKKWNAKSAGLLAERAWEPRKTWACTFCDFRNDRGGQCPIEQR